MSARIPLVSVVIPTFNRAAFITRSIESVVSQSFTDYEIIVVDDASTDTTGELLRRHYADQIRYIAQSVNKGISAARNAGIEKARGTYIAVLDDDDLWLPEKLALQVELLEKNPDVSLAYCGTLRVNGRGEPIAEMKPEKRGHVFEDMLYRNCLMGPASVAIFPRAALRTSGLFDARLSYCADWDLWIRLARCGRLDFVDRPLVQYVIHDSNMHGNTTGMAKDTFAILDTYLPLLTEGGAGAEVIDRIYSSHSIHFAWEYYKQNDLQQFGKLLYRALERCPENHIVMRGDGLREKERAVMAILREYWRISKTGRGRQARAKAFSGHYIQLAWEYYHQDDMVNFRRCILLSWRHALSNAKPRLAIPFFKSFMGKRIAESLHQVRKRVQRVEP